MSHYLEIIIKFISKFIINMVEKWIYVIKGNNGLFDNDYRVSMNTKYYHGRFEIGRTILKSEYTVRSSQCSRRAP